MIALDTQVKLTVKELELLSAMAAKHPRQLSLTVDKPSARVINSLVHKGMARDIMGTFWSITEQGLAQVTATQRAPSGDGHVLDSQPGR
ncbi:hypothetical protein NPS53_09335 [Pseudomonas putida]|uniref:hypothetical protein n=1 Tax=Pseudomonas putida TaxID=303 RepID=UPI002363AD36|nr:hypothetical protein [Pseudomonas putida]MDD2139779.1 hypothetical protein [Pseudomonas putida]HDS1721703.1 hypothetical protein [Pseudomonas putida]